MEKKAVFPGDFLGYEEEFEPGINTFEENGSILSDSVGRAVFDSKAKTVLVEKSRLVELIERDSVVIGRVITVKNSMVSVEIFSAEKNGRSQIVGSSFAAIPVRNIARSYVKEAKEFFKIGDIIKAKVAFITPYSVDLRTNDDDLGVIKAFCSSCRSPLTLFGGVLKCQGCGCSEKRKLSSDYLLK